MDQALASLLLAAKKLRQLVKGSCSVLDSFLLSNNNYIRNLCNMKSVFHYMIIGCLFSFIASCVSPGNNQIHPDFAWVTDSLIYRNSTELMQSVANPHIIDINHAEWPKYISLRDIVDSINVVRLETPAGYEIGKIDKVTLVNDTIFILDRRKSHKLFMFSNTGDFIRCVGSIGQGPGEYAEPTDFDVCGDTIYILDQYKSKIHKFDRQANYISTRSLPFIATGISVPTHNVLFFNNVDADNHHLNDLINYSIYRTNHLLEIEGYGFKHEHGKYSNLWIPSNFYRNEDLTYYHPTYSPDIFTIKHDGCINWEYHIDFGKHAIPEQYMLRTHQDDLQEAEDGNEYYIFAGHFYDTHNWTYFYFAKQHQVYHVFANKSGIVLVSPNIVDDLEYNLPIGDICGVDGNTLISALDPSQIVPGFREASEEVRHSRLTSKGYELCTMLEEEDNPILFFCTMKQ